MRNSISPCYLDASHGTSVRSLCALRYQHEVFMGSMTSPRIPAAQYVPPHAKFLRSTVMAKVLHTQHGINTRSRYPAQCQDDVIMSITILSRSLDAHEDTAMHYLIRSRTTARHIHAQRNNGGRFSCPARYLHAPLVHSTRSTRILACALLTIPRWQCKAPYQRARLKRAPLGGCKVVVPLAKGMWAQDNLFI